MLVACDGSYKPHSSNTLIAVAWSIENNTATNYMIGIIAIDGIKGYAKRGHLLGIYTILIVIMEIEETHPMFNNGKLRIGCNNQEAEWHAGQKHKTV